MLVFGLFEATNHFPLMRPQRLKSAFKDILFPLFWPVIERFFSDTRYFEIFQKKGWHVTRNHFYEPVPDTSALADSLWHIPEHVPGVSLNESGQLNFLSEVLEQFKEEFELFPEEETSVPHQYYRNNVRFCFADAAVLYSIVRKFRPKRIVEIGAGFSTYTSCQALEKNRQESPSAPAGTLTAIDPYPFGTITNGFPGLGKVIEARVQDVPLSEFENLEANDILFIDSSHVLKTGSDVQYEYLEILPRIKPGVLVHFHDIFIPGDYPREWIIENRWFWNESYLVQAFLQFNESFEVVWGARYMQALQQEKFNAMFGSEGQNQPASFWVRRTR